MVELDDEDGRLWNNLVERVEDADAGCYVERMKKVNELIVRRHG